VPSPVAGQARRHELA